LKTELLLPQMQLQYNLKKPLIAVGLIVAYNSGKFIIVKLADIPCCLNNLVHNLFAFAVLIKAIASALFVLS